MKFSVGVYTNIFCLVCLILIHIRTVLYVKLKLRVQTFLLQNRLIIHTVCTWHYN